jgi:hypothetical protein
MNGEYAALSGRILQELGELSQVISHTEAVLNKALQTGDSDYLESVALNLHGFYTGTERIFEDIARHLEQSVPTGPTWHQDLLRQLSAEISTIRPPVLRPETRRCLDEYRSFRHLVRNVYTTHLRPSRIQELAEELRPCYDALTHDLRQFAAFLDQLAQA